MKGLEARLRDDERLLAERGEQASQSIVETRELRERLLDAVTQRNDLVGRVNGLTGQVNDLTGRVNVLTGQVNTLTGENSILVMEGHRLRHETAQNAQLKERFTYLTQSLETEALPASAPQDQRRLHDSLCDSPQSVEEALRQATDLLEISEHLKQDYYQDRLVVISCLEKSGSTMLEICVRDMIAAVRGVAHDIGIQRTLQYGPFSFIGELYPEVLLYAKNGGVLRGVFRPNLFNVKLLDLWKCQHVVLLRHPADRLIGRYCDPTPSTFHTSDGRDWISEPQLPMSYIFGPERDLDEVLLELIEGGYLLDTLAWMTNWLKLRDGGRSTIVRYEDFLTGKTDYLNALARDLFGSALPQDAIDVLQSRFDKYRSDYQPGNKAARRYPKGYSGDIGVWKSYFSPEVLKAYRRVVEHFREAHSDSRLLFDAYPDLSLPDER